jgi:POT family proton-dependent oligopeptide transporter
VQLCERFAFFAMLPLMVLYLEHHHGWNENSAIFRLHVFQALCYVGALPAGAASDRKLGSVMGARLGAGFLALGYGALVLDRPVLLWPALLVMVLGHSFFKPSMGTLVGGLFTDDTAQRERAFQLQYFANNVGAMLGPIGGEWSHARGSWVGVFLWSLSAMSIGTLMLLAYGGRQVGSARPRPLLQNQTEPQQVNDSQRMRIVWLICGLAVIFWMTFQQTGSTLSLFADGHTEGHLTVFGQSIRLGPGHFTSLHCLLVLVLLPLFMMVTAWLRRRRAEPSTLIKMTSGYVANAGAFFVLAVAGLHGADSGRVSPAWLTGCYFLLSVAEVLLAPLGLALLTQIAPPRKTSLAVGLWFAATAVGNVLSGVVGRQLWDRWPPHRYFTLLALSSILAAVVLLLQRRRLEEALRSDFIEQ